MKKITNIPNIEIPEGFEWFYNDLTEHWAFRPIKGYSDQYLKEDSFIPEEKEYEKIVSNKKNTNLHNAKKRKNDEFYTRLEDIVEELKHYKSFFKDKIIYCPCDKAFNLGRSNFFEYFAVNFHSLGIKRLICTQYNPNGKGIMQQYIQGGVKWEYNGEYNDGENIDESRIDTFFLEGDGSFNSEECINIMKKCDIVITNPPFSLFRQFIKQIIDLNKKFLIIGNMNAITYKETFSLIKNNKVWLGYKNPKEFEMPDGSIKSFGNICWFTNLEHNKRKEELYLSKKYSENEYKKYDNYDAIECSKVSNIPFDYDGFIGVPITFLDKYNPSQFKIIGLWSDKRDENPIFIKGNETYLDVKHKRFVGPVIGGKAKYARIVIQKIQK